MKKVLLIILLGLAILLAGFFYLLMGTNKTEKDFVISSGQGTREIASMLDEQGIIKSPVLFSLYVYNRHWFIQPGVYKIRAGASMFEVARILKEGNIKERVITIPEGWRITQIDEYLTENKIIEKGEFLKIASADEGFLFPDTYRLPLDTTAEGIYKLMRDNFIAKTKDLKVTKETIILASIVEREAKLDEDRPKIAGVYLSRIDVGMKLEADPTIQYAKGSWDPITAADYRNVSSSYNTYLVQGLPPGPICNPGLKSIKAILYPEKDGWLFFFHRTDGSAVYSKTIEEHRENLRKN